MHTEHSRGLRALRAYAFTVPFGAILAGCHATASPHLDFARSERRIEMALDEGARGDLGAAGYLDLALDELHRARVHAARGELRDARSLAIRSWADAEIARVLAVEVRARQAARRAADQASDLAGELDQDELPPTTRSAP